ncbi:MAG: amidohydrolase family protein [Ignavibacteriales bacterium]
MDLLIKNAKILTMNSNMDVIEKGNIAIRDDKIYYVSDNNVIPPDFSTSNVIDAKGMLVMPGLVNAHTHIAMTLLRNYADDLPLEQWLFNKIFPVEDKMIPEDIYWGSMLGIVEMIKSGTTCFADMYSSMEEVARAVAETGIRANLSRGLICPDNDFTIENDIRIKETRELFNNWHGKENGRIKVYVAPHSVYTCCPSYLQETVNLAKELNTGIHIHLLETKVEERDSIKNFGCTSIEHCDKMGMFDVPTIAAHCVHLSDQDLNVIAKRKVNIAHNPGSNLKLASGIARLPEMLHKGINVALGTDGTASNNNLDMFEEIRLAALISKGFHMNAVLITAAESLRMAVNNGAKALGFGDEVGEIKAGMKADLLIIDTDRANYIPANNMISALAYSSNSQDVDTVIVDGKILMKHRELKTIDEEKVKHMVRKKANDLFSRV